MTTEYMSDKEAIEHLKLDLSPEDRAAVEKLFGPNFNPPVSPAELVDLIIEYEEGEGSQRNMLRLFGELIRTGQCWSMQGHYGRAASNLIEVGAIDREGGILYPLDLT